MSSSAAPKKLRSATIRDGLVRAPTRVFFYALGEDDQDIARPTLAFIHTGGEMSTCT